MICFDNAQCCAGGERPGGAASDVLQSNRKNALRVYLEVTSTGATQLTESGNVQKSVSHFSVHVAPSVGVLRDR